MQRVGDLQGQLAQAERRRISGVRVGSIDNRQPGIQRQGNAVSSVAMRGLLHGQECRIAGIERQVVSGMLTYGVGNGQKRDDA